jgi:hypothetical protein
MLIYNKEFNINMPNTIKPVNQTPKPQETGPETPISRGLPPPPHQESSIVHGQREKSLFSKVLETVWTSATLSLVRWFPILHRIWPFSLSTRRSEPEPTPPQQVTQLPDEEDTAVYYDAEDVNDDDFFDADDGTPATTAPTPQPVVQLTPHQELLNALLMSLPETFVSIGNRASRPLFAVYLFQSIFKNPNSCDFNKTTGKFTLSFSEKKVFSVTQVPTDASPASKDMLKLLKGTNLVIAETISGYVKEGAIEFAPPSEGAPPSLSVQWTSFYVPQSASLLRLSKNQTNDAFINIKGKYTGIIQTQPILAQDFVNTLILNGLK